MSGKLRLYLLWTLLHPLSRFGPRFFTLNEPYDVEWRAQALQVSSQLGIRSKVKEGIYTMLGGPNFETPAELRMLHMCGVDAVGKLHHPILALFPMLIKIIEPWVYLISWQE